MEEFNKVLHKYVKASIDKNLSNDKNRLRQVHRETKTDYSVLDNGDWECSFLFPKCLQTQQKKIILETACLDLRQDFNIVLELEYKDITEYYFATIYFIQENQV